MIHRSLTKQEVLTIGNYYVDNNSTVRATADALGYSKTRVHDALVRRLPKYSCVLADSARKILDKNWEEKNARGGKAVQEKFRKLKNQ